MDERERKLAAFRRLMIARADQMGDQTDHEEEPLNRSSLVAIVFVLAMLGLGIAMMIAMQR